MTEFRLCATGVPLLRQSVRAIDPVVKEMLGLTRRELQIASYLFLDAGGDLLGCVEDAAGRGIKTTIVINRLEEHPQQVREWAVRMSNTYDHVDIRTYRAIEGGQLHAKVIVCDRSKAIIGSANLTTSGMSRNIEIGAMISGDAAWDLGLLVDEIAKAAVVFHQVGGA